MNASMIQCPGCGERVLPDMTKCPRCRAKLVISSYADIRGMSSITLNKYIVNYKKLLVETPGDKKANMSMALCYLGLRVYDKAQSAFAKVIDDDAYCAEAYFYAAVCLLNGKKAFLTGRQIIDKALEYISAAITIEPRGVYYLFSAYIKYDYFARKSYNVTPDFKSELAMAKANGLSVVDSSELFAILGVDCPAELI